jgi:cytochrome c biogenesis protein CcmG/thiol:disulfide interchange protein DsbE
MIRAIFIICVLIATFKAWGYWTEHHTIGHIAHLEVPMLDGHRLDIQEERGKVVVVMFWASWCPPCRAEMPTMEEYYQRHRNEGLVVLALNADDSDSHNDALEMMKLYSFKNGFVMGAKGDRLGFSGPIPRTAVIDRQGILQKTWGGGRAPPSAEMDYLEETITPLLQAKQ